MGYREDLVKEDSWDVFEEALEEAVERYVEGLADHLLEEYSSYNVEVKGLDSREELVNVLGLQDFEIELSAEDENRRAYNLHLPDIEEPLLVDVERSVAESSNASDEDRETVAYHLIPRSGEQIKFNNIRSEFQRITQPDSVEGDVSIFYREGEADNLAEASSWDIFDEKGLMGRAVEIYEEQYGADVNFDVSLETDSGKGWRIYQFDFGDIEEPMYLEVKVRGNGFAFNWKQDTHQRRYMNFVRYGFSEAIQEFND